MNATYTAAVPPQYPVRVEGELGEPSRWLWLVKWLLVLPHLLVLAFLWPAFVLSSVASFVVVAVTGRYPRALFDFNLGVMRWSWRVAFYAYAANGTDAYPPFTLGELPDYPARLEISYPARQRSGFALIGWWLAGIPQYLVALVFMGGGVFAWTAWAGGAGWGGLIGLLVLVAAVVLLVRGIYPRTIFDFVLGLDRWVLRVVAYAAVMTSEYPPFRLDAGEREFAGAVIATPSAPTRTAHNRPTTWATRRIVTTVLASITTLIGIALIAVGATGVAFDQTQRNGSGYLMTPSASYSTGTYAVTSRSYELHGVGGAIGREVLGTINVRSQSSTPTFVGIAPAKAAETYLAQVAHAEARSLDASNAGMRSYHGRAPLVRPAAERFWVASSTGSGLQNLNWKVRRGTWRVVVMNVDGSRDVAASLSVGASAPNLLTIALVSLAAGVLLLLIGGTALYRTNRKRG